MRRLNEKQKKIIQVYWENDLLDSCNVDYTYNKNFLLSKLEEINDYETLWCDLDRLISDLHFSNGYKQTIKNFS